jgi:hypothetical protein
MVMVVIVVVITIVIKPVTMTIGNWITLKSLMVSHRRVVGIQIAFAKTGIKCGPIKIIAVSGFS